MWTTSLVMQAVAWVVLIALSPFIFIYVRKVAVYLSYRFLPRDVLLEYRENGNLTQAFYVKRSLFKRDNVIELKGSDLSPLRESP